MHPLLPLWDPPSLAKEDCLCDFSPVDFIHSPSLPTNSLYYHLHHLLELIFPNLVMKQFGYKTEQQPWWHLAS